MSIEIVNVESTKKGKRTVITVRDDGREYRINAEKLAISFMEFQNSFFGESRHARDDDWWTEKFLKMCEAVY